MFLLEIKYILVDITNATYRDQSGAIGRDGLQRWALGPLKTNRGFEFCHSIRNTSNLDGKVSKDNGES